MAGRVGEVAHLVRVGQQIVQLLGRLLRLEEGRLVVPEHRLRGIERVAEAFCDLFAGRNLGKTIVEL